MCRTYFYCISDTVLSYLFIKIALFGDMHQPLSCFFAKIMAASANVTDSSRFCCQNFEPGQHTQLIVGTEKLQPWMATLQGRPSCPTYFSCGVTSSGMARRAVIQTDRYTDHLGGYGDLLDMAFAMPKNHWPDKVKAFKRIRSKVA